MCCDVQNEVLLNLSATGPATLRDLNNTITTDGSRYTVKNALFALIDAGLVAAFRNEDFPRGTIYSAV